MLVIPKSKLRLHNDDIVKVGQTLPQATPQIATQTSLKADLSPTERSGDNTLTKESPKVFQSKYSPRSSIVDNFNRNLHLSNSLQSDTDTLNLDHSRKKSTKNQQRSPFMKIS